MRVVRDEPGRALVLEAAPGRGRGGAGCLLLFLLPLALAPLVMLAGVLGVGQGLGAVLALAAFSLVWYGILVVAAVAIVRATVGLRRLSLDAAASGRLEAAASGPLGLFARHVDLPLAEIRSIGLELGPPGRSRPGRWAARLTLSPGASGGPDATFPLAVEGMDRREEVLDLAFRMAAVAGLGSWRLLRNDPRELALVLLRGPEEGSEPVPVPRAPSDYEWRVGTAIELPAEEVPPFDPAAFDGPFQVQRWEPGREVRLYKPFEGFQCGCVVALLTVFSAAIGGFFGVLLWEEFPALALGVASLVAGLWVLGVTLTVRGSLSQLSVVDWGRRRVTFRRGHSTVEFPFDALEGVDCVGVRTTHSESRGQGRSSTTRHYDTYRCELRVRRRRVPGLEAGECTLARTRDHQEDGQTPYRQCYPMAAELARALGLPHAWREY